jgi:hypothetical protein
MSVWLCCLFLFTLPCTIIWKRIGGVMVSMLASSAAGRGFNPRSGQTKDYKIGICCFSTKHAALRRKSKDWLAQNQDNVSEWGDVSICGLLFQWASTIKIQITCGRVKLVLWATLILSYNHANSLHTSCHWPFECEMLKV